MKLKYNPILEIAVLFFAAFGFASAVSAAIPHGVLESQIRTSPVAATYRIQPGATASSHSTNTYDMETTEKIRRQLMSNGTLSMAAKNIQIITQDGKVSLKGIVDSEAERQTVERIASGIAGADKVVNETSSKK